MQQPTTTIKFSAITLAPNEALPAFDHARAICGVQFDAYGQTVNPGPATEHLSDTDMQAFCDLLIDTALDMLQLHKPTYGILYIHAASSNDVHAYYLPSGVIHHIDHASGTLH